MKKSILILSILSLLMNFSCKKSTDGNKNILVAERTYRYIAEDNSSALVTFTNSDKGNIISIRSNNKTITLPQKDSDGEITVYENDGIEVKSEENRITITQGNIVISLRKAKGE